MKKFYSITLILICCSAIIVKAQNISINTTGATNSSLSMLEILQLSATANSKGLYIANSGVIAGSGYGIWSQVTGASTTNVAGYFSASGAINNYGIIVPSGGGKVGIGTTTPILPLHVISNGNTAPLYLKAQSAYDAFSILPWNGVTYLSAGVYYNNSAWVHDAATTSNELIAMQPNAGVLWYNSNNSAPSWNVASGAVQWDVNGYWKNLVQSTAAGNSYFMGGNVGIGTTAPAYTLDLNQGTFGFGVSDVRTEYKDDAGLQGNAGSQSGFFQTAAPAPAADWPTGASSWWHLIDCRHSNSANNYALQIAGSFFDQNLYFRKTNGSANTAWSQVLTTSSLKVFTALASQTSVTTSSYVYVTGLSISITTSTQCAFVINTAGTLESQGGSGTWTGTITALERNGSNITEEGTDIINPTSPAINEVVHHWDISYTEVLPAGTYVYKIKCKLYNGTAGFYAGGALTTSLPNDGTMTVLVIPQ